MLARYSVQQPVLRLCASIECAREQDQFYKKQVSVFRKLALLTSTQSSESINAGLVAQRGLQTLVEALVVLKIMFRFRIVAREYVLR